jgi:hypothetical protein
MIPLYCDAVVGRYLDRLLPAALSLNYRLDVLGGIRRNR